jgi:thiol-disulfide isomerase/thioredoxin
MTPSRGERRRRSRERQSATAPHRGRRIVTGKFFGFAAGAVILGGLAFVAVTGFGGGRSVVNAETEALARVTSRSEIETITGSAHTVYHSTEPLPTSNEPRADGLPTLVWFSGSWCPFCERMGPFTYEVASRYRDRMIFAEKSVDHDRDAARRFGVRGTPTFVMLDAGGGELARFYFQGSARALDAVMTQALAGQGASDSNASTLTNIE